MAVSLNVKLVTPRPGGVAPGSETLAAAHTISVGQSPFTPVSESGTSRSNLRSAALRCPCSSSTRLSANAVHSRRR